MTNLSPHGYQRMPLPPAQESPTRGTPSEESEVVNRSGTPSSPGKNRPKQRDPFFDNAKYLAIVLVATAHAWEPLTSGSRAAYALYMLVYAFHMPAFIFISGYFSRGFDMRPDKLRRLITGVAVPYVIFETVYSLFKRYGDDAPDHPISLLSPWYLTWFLIALFVWRLTTPIWKLVRWPLPVALVIAALATLSPEIGSDLNLQRVLQFLPFFVAGLCAKPEHFDLIRRRTVRLIALPVFACALVFTYWVVPRLETGWLYHSAAAEDLDAPSWAGPVMTLALFGCSMLLTVCFYALVPKRHMWFTTLGAGTLYGYLLHGFFIQGSRFWGWYDLSDWIREPVGAVVITLLAGVLVTLLCTPPVQRVFRFAMEPKMPWAFRRDAVREARERTNSQAG